MRAPPLGVAGDVITAPRSCHEVGPLRAPLGTRVRLEGPGERRRFDRGGTALGDARPGRGRGAAPRRPPLRERPPASVSRRRRGLVILQVVGAVRPRREARPRPGERLGIGLTGERHVVRGGLGHGGVDEGADQPAAAGVGRVRHRPLVLPEGRAGLRVLQHVRELDRHGRAHEDPLRVPPLDRDVEHRVRAEEGREPGGVGLVDEPGVGEAVVLEEALHEVHREHVVAPLGERDGHGGQEVVGRVEVDAVVHHRHDQDRARLGGDQRREVLARRARAACDEHGQGGGERGARREASGRGHRVFSRAPAGPRVEEAGVFAAAFAAAGDARPARRSALWIIFSMSGRDSGHFVFSFSK
jgi:hypothetical protein